MSHASEINRHLANVAQVPLRTFERVAYVMEHGIPELNAAMLEDIIKPGPAERIARLPQDRQLAAMEDHQRGRLQKRGPRTVTTDLESIADQINRMSGRWSQRDRLIAARVFEDFARQLAGVDDDADETAVAA